MSETLSIARRALARDVFLAEMFAAIDEGPDAVAEVVDVEVARRARIAEFSPTWETFGHLFATEEAPESQTERDGGYGYCVRCGFMLFKSTGLAVAATRLCAPARVEIRGAVR